MCACLPFPPRRQAAPRCNPAPRRDILSRYISLITMSRTMPIVHIGIFVLFLSFDPLERWRRACRGESRPGWRMPFAGSRGRRAGARARRLSRSCAGRTTPTTRLEWTVKEDRCWYKRYASISLLFQEALFEYLGWSCCCLQALKCRCG